MDKMEFYTKGDREDVLSRMNQVHTITLFCPLNDLCVYNFKTTVELMLPGYKISDNEWKNIPAIDVLNVFICCNAYQKSLGVNSDNDIMNIMISSLGMFKRLKYISLVFTYDDEIEKTYRLLIQKKKEGIKKYIYNVDRLEMNLPDMFSQRIIDILNKVLMHNDQIPNSYLERKFLLDFSYDDYVSFMGMFLNNNKDELNEVDKNIYDYFTVFPKLINEQKPNIRLITNYSD